MQRHREWVERCWPWVLDQVGDLWLVVELGEDYERLGCVVQQEGARRAWGWPLFLCLVKLEGSGEWEVPGVQFQEL